MTTPHHDIAVKLIQRWYLCKCGGDLYYTREYSMQFDVPTYKHTCKKCGKVVGLPNRSGSVIFIDPDGKEQIICGD